MSARPHSVAPPTAAEDAKSYTLAAMPPTAFGKYVLVGKLGHGGMAEVNLAVTGGKGGFRKLFVIKRLHAHLEAEPGFVDMFLDEARLAAQLDHPHCVQTVEVGEVNGQHFLAMEYLDGQGLERLLRMAAAKNETLPPAIAVRIAIDALDGLGYAHELSGFDGQPLGVVHRDISPQNLFVTYTGVVKVLDFGIAKAASNVVETRTGVIKGKYAYIAPEQALANHIDARADLWSMGVVFWELLTTRRLFKSVNELATLQETLRGDIRPPSAVQPGIPPELDAIAMRALQRDPDQRYATAAAFKADLEHWLERQPYAPDRRAISALMKERFGDIIAVQKQKLRECLAAVAQGETSVERLIEGGALASAELAALHPLSAHPHPSSPGTHTPSGQILAPEAARGAHGPYPTPTPYPSNPYVNPYPSNPYVAPPPTPYPSNPWVPAPVTGAAPLPTEATMRLQPPPPKERTRRSVGWWLVAIAALCLAAVLGAILLRPGASSDVASTGLPGAVPGAVPGTGGIGVRVVSADPPAVPATAVPAAVLAPGTVAAPVAEAGTAVGTSEAGAGTVEDTAEDTDEPSRGGGRRIRRGSGGSSPAEPPPVVGSAPGTGATTGSSGGGTAPEGTTEAPSDVGFLTLATSPWTSVTCAGRSLGETPLMRVSLPVGHHSCRLVNADEGISETYEVDIRPGETTRVRLGLR